MSMYQRRRLAPLWDGVLTSERTSPGLPPVSLTRSGRGRSVRVSGLEECLVFDRHGAAEGVLASAAVVGLLDPDQDRQAQSCRVVQRFRSRTFFCSREKNDSMAALSAHAPTRPMDPVRPA